MRNSFFAIPVFVLLISMTVSLRMDQGLGGSMKMSMKDVFAATRHDVDGCEVKRHEMVACKNLNN